MDSYRYLLLRKIKTKQLNKKVEVLKRKMLNTEKSAKPAILGVDRKVLFESQAKTWKCIQFLQSSAENDISLLE